MNSKRFTFNFLLAFLLIIICTYSLYYLVNPEQIFSSSLTKYKYFYNKEYSRKQFEMLKVRKSILVFGTSQTHMISSEMMKNNVLNFHNLYAEPGDILNFIKQLNSDQLNNIEKVIFLIDLRAGAIRVDNNLIDYNKGYFPMLTFTSIKRTFLDLNKNYLDDSEYLNKDGSINSEDHYRHIKDIPPYPGRAILEYNDNLIQGLLEINEYLKRKNIEIRFITPVVNDKYLKAMDLKKLSIFFENLLIGGIDNIGVFYYIKDFSEKNDKNEYIAFIQNDHLNYFYVKKWLFNYILKDSEYTIVNINSLKVRMKNLEKRKSSNSG